MKRALGTLPTQAEIYGFIDSSYEATCSKQKSNSS